MTLRSLSLVFLALIASGARGQGDPVWRFSPRDTGDRRVLAIRDSNATGDEGPAWFEVEIDGARAPIRTKNPYLQREVFREDLWRWTGGDYIGFKPGTPEFTERELLLLAASEAPSNVDEILLGDGWILYLTDAETGCGGIQRLELLRVSGDRVASRARVERHWGDCGVSPREFAATLASLDRDVESLGKDGAMILGGELHLPGGARIGIASPDEFSERAARANDVVDVDLDEPQECCYDTLRASLPWLWRETEAKLDGCGTLRQSPLIYLAK